MVNFVSVTKGIFLISIIIIGSAQAAPSINNNIIRSSNIPRNYTLPPYIASRTQIHGSGLNYIEPNLSATNPLNRLEATIGDIVISASPIDILELSLNAALSSAAYCRSVTALGIWGCANCLKFLPDGKLVHTFNSKIGDTTGYIVRSDLRKTIYLTFRGTNSFTQSVVDLTIVKEDYNPVIGAKVHKGFYDAFKDVILEYFFFMENEITFHPDYKIVINGHSLGGSQALLAGLDLFQRDRRVNRNNLSIYTQGSLRVGDSIFALYVASTGIPFVRSVHKKDIAPHILPKFLGFEHAGIEAWEYPDNIFRICLSNKESKLCSDSLGLDLNSDDHSTYFGLDEGHCL